ncbi:hypothetical protein F5888DRAFT_1740960 [Russula emetica]|nr:hypothetical protein F5888DRAFT_1740960 [Russula emetica]
MVKHHIKNRWHPDMERLPTYSGNMVRVDHGSTESFYVSNASRCPPRSPYLTIDSNYADTRAARHGPSPRFFCHYFSLCTSIIPVAWSLAIATYSLSTLQVLAQRLGGKSHADNVDFIPFPPLLSVAVLTGRFVNFHSLSPPRLTRGTSDFKAEQQIVVPNPACFR